MTVLEAADSPGGAVRTEELTLPGFRHDTFSSVYPAGAASPVFARMPLDRHGLRWVQPEACYAHPLPDGTAVTLYRDVERTAATLDRERPGDGARWAAFAGPYLDAFPALRATMLGGFPPLRGPARLLLALGPRGLVEFGRLTLDAGRRPRRRALRRAPGRARGSTGRRCTATFRRRAAAAPSPPATWR